MPRMSARTARLLLLLPWLSLPLVLAAYAVAWERVPARLAVHFDWDGTPNGWMGRWESLVFNSGVLLFVLLMCTLKIYSRGGPSESPGQLATLNLAVMFVTLIFLGVLKYNVTGSLF